MFLIDDLLIGLLGAGLAGAGGATVGSALGAGALSAAGGLGVNLLAKGLQGSPDYSQYAQQLNKRFSDNMNMQYLPTTPINTKFLNAFNGPAQRYFA